MSLHPRRIEVASRWKMSGLGPSMMDHLSLSSKKVVGTTVGVAKAFRLSLLESYKIPSMPFKTLSNPHLESL